jgi:flagellar basal-body rod protein FlgB
MDISPEMNSVNMFQDALDGSTRRQEAIADNMANVNTPGYKRKEVAFQDKLKEAYMGDGPEVPLHQAHPQHISLGTEKPVQPSQYQVNDTNMRNDENNVDPDRQMSKMAKNEMYYRGLSSFLRQQFRNVGSVIQDLKQV